MKKMMTAALLGSLVAATVAAEDVGPGARVRIKGTDRMLLVGTVVEAEGGALTVRPSKGEPRRIRLADVARLEVSRRRSRKGKGALVGFAVGAVGGFILGASTNSDGCQPSEYNPCWLFGNGPLFSDAQLGVMSAVALSGVGALVGAIAAPGERWDAVSDSRVRLSVTPSRSGAAVGLTLRF